MVLSLTLPMAGTAGAAFVAEPCPMQQLHKDMSKGIIEDSCFDKEKSFHSGSKICKTGEQCQANSAIQVTSLKIFPPLESLVIHQPLAEFIPYPSLDTVWRPPRV